MKQSGRNWHNVLRDHLKELNFVQSNVDPCVFVKSDDSGTTILIVWIYDIIFAASPTLLLNEIKQRLNSKFNMKDLGPLSSFLGIHFEQNEDVITMSQSQYLKKILEKFGFENCKLRGTPCETNPDVYNTDTITDEIHPRKYRQMIGSLVYAVICTRPDLIYVVTKLSQHLSKPTSGDLLMLNHVFRYVKSTVEYHLTFRKGDNVLQITAYSLTKMKPGSVYFKYTESILKLYFPLVKYA